MVYSTVNPPPPHFPPPPLHPPHSPLMPTNVVLKVWRRRRRRRIKKSIWRPRDCICSIMVTTRFPIRFEHTKRLITRLREGFRKQKQKKSGPGAHFGGGGLKKYLPVHNSIVIFGKLSLGANLIVQLCIFSCKDKSMLGYNVLVMYLRAIGIFFVSIKKICEKISH